MKTFDLTWTRESYNGTFCALIIKAEDETTARAYFSEYKPDAKIVGISEECDIKVKQKGSRKGCLFTLHRKEYLLICLYQDVERSM